MRSELVLLLENKSPKALEVARNYQGQLRLLTLPQVQAEGHLLLGRALMQAPDLHAALHEALTAATLYGRLHDSSGQAEAETLAGRVNLNLGALEAAEQQLRRALLLVQAGRTAREQRLYAEALNQLAGVQYSRGAASEALLSLETALRMWRTLDDPVGQGSCLTNIGIIQSALGQYHEAIQTLGQAYELYRTELQDPRSEGVILGNLARIHSLNQDRPLAVEVAQAALVAAEASQDQVLISACLLNLGTFCLEAGLAAEAEAHLNGALRLSREVGSRTGELNTLDSLGLLYQQTDRLAEARQAHLDALAISLELDYPQGELEARLHLGAVELTLEHLEAAQQQVERSLELAAESQSPREEAQAHRTLAVIAERRGDFRAAYRHSQDHLRINGELFEALRDRQTRNLSIQFEVERAKHDADVYRVKTEAAQEARLVAEQLVQERTGELARAQHEVVNRLAMAAEYRDDTTGEHTRRVGRSAARLARALGWSEERAKILGIAARLHDVGKIGIPDSILLKADRLTAAEFEQMKTHTLIGARILSGGRSELLRLAEEIALSHHERWDGSGYPRGLRATEIPLTGRIVALADVFDALTQDRPYKRAWTTEDALSELRKQAGAHFDPVIVETALRVLNPATGQPGASVAEDVMLDEEDATYILSVFEQLLVERTRDLEAARQEAEQSVAVMARMAYTDSLTGLANRRAFEADLELTFQNLGPAAAQPSGALTVISFDLDGLKAANDTLGHGGGDALLQIFSRSLELTFSEVGRAYRIGGDEFAVIGRQTPGDDVIGELRRKLIERAREEGAPGLSASMGVARYPQDARTPGDLLRISDRRMYQDKLGRRTSRRPAQ
ncbi:HD domain-containing phosphohydrolase [Deinococcus sp.]|uniref:HD domain-containing phosphohydrolase n=1 Tax=Deinococcus sp. TaxID=47478 RepID=UPI003C7B1269